MKQQGLKVGKLDLGIGTNMKLMKLRPLHIAISILLILIIYILVSSQRNKNEVEISTTEQTSVRVIQHSTGSESPTPRLNGPIHLQYADTEDMLALSLDHCRAPTLEQLFSQNYVDNYINMPALMQHMKDVCNTTPDFSKLEDQVLYLTDLRYQDCCIAEVTRPLKDANDSFTLERCIHIDASQRAMDVSHKEYLAVRCRQPNSTAQVYNFHANVPTTGRLKPLVDYWKGQPDRPYSIFVLVIDSTSRAEMFRSLPMTMDYLLHQMNFVQFNGHHALGEPTQPNAMPMLMGIQRTTFQRNYFDFNLPGFWDSAPFIWQVFNELNYFTGYFEDEPEVGTFNYGGQLGFEYQPTTLYTRPLMLAHTWATNRTNHLHYFEFCFGRRNVIEFMLDYHFRTLETLSDFPTFQVTWPCWTQHDIGGSLSFLDTTYLGFFKKIFENKKIIDTTLFMVVSDHGYYNSMTNKYANTYESLIERRNMPLFVRLPDKLKAQHPEFQDSLEWNSKVITSHYDIYQTFLHIARMEGQFQPLSNLHTYGSSLLTKIPEARTCQEARIPKTMCICNRRSHASSIPFTKDDSLIDRQGFDVFE